MKDTLDIIEHAGTLSWPWLITLLTCVFVYFLYFIWKNHLSENTRLETKKRRLELLKLALEIEELRKQNPEPSSCFAKQPIDELLEMETQLKSREIYNRLKTIVTHPLRWFFDFFTGNKKWMPPFFMATVTAAVWPAFIACHTLLHLPPNLSAATISSVLLILLGMLASTIILSAFCCAVVATILKVYGTLTTLLNGFAFGMAIFQLEGLLLLLFLRLSQVFVNAH
jgi:hypothetical protein